MTKAAPTNEVAAASERKPGTLTLLLTLYRDSRWLRSWVC